MSKTRDLADFVAAGNPLADGTIDVADINGVTATAAEINILDGLTATTTELNNVAGINTSVQTQLDAKAPIASPTFTGTATYATLSDGTTTLTSTVAELNILDGVTATTAEINYLDGVTSNIQTQFNALITDLVSDTTPQLGGDLDTNGNDINFGDNDKARFGAGPDLLVYHDGGHSYVTDSGTGNLYISGDDIIIRNTAGTELKAQFISNGAVNLFYDNSKKFETTTSGVTITGDILPSVNASYDLGSTSFSFRNLYTNDLHLSNENLGQGNDVDGTTGNWTIQEGSDSLYIINNKNGKKYKFALELVE
jgi:hypothetical protein